MKLFTLILFSGLLIIGCSKDRDNKDQTASKSPAPATAPDNTGTNVRDRSGDTKTPGDQSENEADRKITQDVRKSIVDNDKLSTNAQNVKIITSDGKVTLRGPVKSDQEKKEIENKAKQVAGVKNVDNQLEVAAN